MEYDRKGIKRRAREAIRETRPRPWKTTLLFLLLAGVAPALLEGIMLLPVLSVVGDLLESGRYLTEDAVLSLSQTMMGGSLVTEIVSIAILFLTTALSFGYCGWALRIYTGKEARCRHLFSGFSVMWKAIASTILSSLFTALWSLIFVLPGTIIMVLVILYTAWGSIPLVVGWIVTAVLLIAMVLGELFVSYRYSLVPFFIMATPGIGVMEAIRASRGDMRGSLGRRFMLDLSFIGWELLTALISGAASGVVSGLIAWAGLPAIRQGIFLGDWSYDMAVTAWVILGALAGAFVGALVSLPMRLWLTEYETVARAGFFSAVTGYWSPNEALPGGTAADRPPMPLWEEKEQPREETPLWPLREDGPLWPPEPEEPPAPREDGRSAENEPICLGPSREEPPQPAKPPQPEEPPRSMPEREECPAPRPEESPAESPRPAAPRTDGYRQPFQWGYQPPEDGQ